MSNVIGIFTTSETTQTCGQGNYVFTLDNPTGFAVGGIVQIWSNTDNSNLMVGTITQVSGTNITVAVFIANGGITDASWTVNQVGIHSQVGTNPSSALTVDNTTDVSVVLGSFPVQGTTIFFNVEPGKAFSNYSSVYVQCMADYTSWFIGTVLSYDPVGGGMNLFVTLVGQGQTTSGPWAISLMSSTATDADLTAYASDTLTPTVGSNITFTTVQAGKYFPIQGVVLIDDLFSIQNPTGTDNHYTGTIVAYNGNTLIVNITSAFGTGTQSSSWGIYLINGPTTRIPLYSMTGLQAFASGRFVKIAAGSIRDSTDTIDLVLTAPFTLSAGVGVGGTGSWTTNGTTTVTGSGTNFTSFLSSTATLTDLNNQLTALNQSTVSFPTVLTLSGVLTTYSRGTTNVASDTSLTVGSTVVTDSGSVWTRGLVGANFTSTVWFGFGLEYIASTGVVQPFITSFTPNGIPDIDPGATYYRIIGYYSYDGTNLNIFQPLLSFNVINVPANDLIVGTGTSVPTYLAPGSSGTVLTTVINVPTWSSGSATVFTTGTPSSGNLVQFSGLNSITTITALPGTTTATTQAAGDNTTKVATDAFVTTAINNAIAGVNPAVAVQAATTAAGNTSTFVYNNGVAGIGATFTGSSNAPVVIDGFTFTALGQRLLVKNDTQAPSGAFNGVYYVTQVQTALLPPILTRALDYDSSSDINNTGAIPVVNGTVNALTSWLLTSTVNTVGTDPLTYSKFSNAPLGTGATLQATPTGQTSNSTSVLRMMGFGNQCSITPASTGNVEFTFDGGIVGSATQMKEFQTYYGTGTAASSGAAVSGTAIGPLVISATPSAGGQLPFSATRLITGLVVGTPVWLDMAIASVSSGAATISLTNINCAAKES